MRPAAAHSKTPTACPASAGEDFPGRKLVVAGDPEGSLLYRKMAGTQTADEGGAMPPSGGGPAAAPDPALAAIVRDWIAAGASTVCDSTGPLPDGGVQRHHPVGFPTARTATAGRTPRPASAERPPAKSSPFAPTPTMAPSATTSHGTATSAT